MGGADSSENGSFRLIDRHLPRPIADHPVASIVWLMKIIAGPRPVFAAPDAPAPSREQGRDTCAGLAAIRMVARRDAHINGTALSKTCLGVIIDA